MEKKTQSKRITELDSTEIILAPHEALVLWRRRKHWNQSIAASYYKVPVFVYKMTEYGKQVGFKLPKNKLKKIEDNEKCFIYRRRCGNTQEEIAKLVGCGKYWIQLQELGKVPCHKLLKFWEDKNRK